MLAMLALDRRADATEAARCHRRAAELNAQAGNHAGLARNYDDLGVLAREGGDITAAQSWFAQARDAHRRAGSAANPGEDYAKRGLMAQNRGDHDEAERRYRQSLEVNERFGAELGVASAHHVLGRLAHERGDDDEAQRRYQQSLALTEPRADQVRLATCYHSFGELRTSQRRLAEAVQWHARAYAAWSAADCPTATSVALLARLRARVGEHEFGRAVGAVLSNRLAGRLRTAVSRADAP